MWTTVVSLSLCVSTVTILMFCLCWRKKSPKNDLLGLHGMVTQKNPDENVNHLIPAAPCVVDGVNVTANNAEHCDPLKRPAAPTNTRRSLPDIPSEQAGAVNWEPAGDNSSEHYATVGQYQNAKRHTLPNGIETRPSISQHSSMSQADDAFSPYEKVKYDKIKSKEHPYAQLQPSTSRQASVLEETSASVDERTTLLRVDGPSTSTEPSVPVRSRRSSTHSGLGVDIPAASAVAGGIAASPELPYMTPPVNQPNFSGDSQDSSKGYTSISVREPLANILAQTKEIHKKRELDPHYSTVSDDSDDVYTTIPDPNSQIYTSESETYARIPAAANITVEAEVNPLPSRCLEEQDDVEDELYEVPPQPPLPSVDSLKQVTAHSHSRQASSSSSIANVGSPKPEKRQANSPLPPPPSTSSFDFRLDKIQGQKNLDDLYAKVYKNKKKDDSDSEKSPEKHNNDDNQNKPSTSAATPAIDNKLSEVELQRREHNYETLRKSNRQESDPGYEKIKQEEPGYSSINGPDSITGSDPGYEVLKQGPPSETDPNYEELRHRNSNASDCAGYSKIKSNSSLDSYSVINKQKSDERSRTSSSYGSNFQDVSLDEPNYESMPSESSEHNYAALKSTDSESDPNYERVKDLEPPYEPVSAGGFHQVAGHGYENIDSSESSNGTSDMKPIKKFDPPYEELVSEAELEVPGYERIKNSTKNSRPNVKAASSQVNSNDLQKVDRETTKEYSNLVVEDEIFQV